MGLSHNLNMRSMALASLLVAATLLSAQSTLIAEKRYVGTIVAVVNDKIITDEDLQRRASAALSEAVKKYKGRELQSRAEGIFENVLGELIDRQLLVQKAHFIIEKNPYVMEEIEKDLDSFIGDAVAEVGSLSKFYEIAVKEGINPTEKKIELKDDLMVERLLSEYVYRKINVSPRDVREYYQEHKDEFVKEKSVKIAQMMLLFSSYSSKKEAREKANEIRARALSGEDFDALVKELSEGPRASSGGVWEFDEVLALRGKLRKTALGLQKKEISEVVETSRGLHVFLAVDVRSTKEPDFAALQAEIKNRLFNERGAKRKKEYVRELKKNAEIRIVRTR
ncbi:MAG: peptidylprolyl isomerase [Candidatus Brocadiales bacterium]